MRQLPSVTCEERLCGLEYCFDRNINSQNRYQILSINFSKLSSFDRNLLKKFKTMRIWK